MAAKKKAVDTARKWCTGCKLPLPVSEFATVNGERLHSKCTACRRGSGKAARERQRERIVKEQVAALIEEINRGNQLNATVIATGLVAELGGLQAFLRRWAEQINAACAAKAGSKTVLDAFYGVFKTVQASDERLKGFDALREMSEEELATVAYTLLMEQAQGDDPQADAAIQALAAARGLKVVPMPESEAG